MRNVKRWRTAATFNAEHAEGRQEGRDGQDRQDCFHHPAHPAYPANPAVNFPRSTSIVVSPDAEQQINHELIEALVRQRA